jgi:hypothetical protein
VLHHHSEGVACCRDVPQVLLTPVQTSGSLMPVTFVERTNTLGALLPIADNPLSTAVRKTATVARCSYRAVNAVTPCCAPP